MRRAAVHCTDSVFQLRGQRQRHRLQGNGKGHGACVCVWVWTSSLISVLKLKKQGCYASLQAHARTLKNNSTVCVLYVLYKQPRWLKTQLFLHFPLNPYRNIAESAIKSRRSLMTPRALINQSGGGWDACGGLSDWEPRSSSSSVNRILTGWVLKRHPWRLSSNWIELHLISLPSSFGSLPLIRVRCRVSQASVSLFSPLSLMKLSHIAQLISAKWANKQYRVAHFSERTPWN